jgi:hypothetical protein
MESTQIIDVYPAESAKQHQRKSQDEDQAPHFLIEVKDNEIPRATTGCAIDLCLDNCGCWTEPFGPKQNVGSVSSDQSGYARRNA